METEPKIVEQYIATGKVRLVYRHLLQLGEESMRLAEGSECAADQGKFWEMRRAIYEGQADIYGSSSVDAALAVFAQDLKLDTGAYNECMVSRKHQAAIQANFEAAQAEGIRSRPVFDINGTRMLGARPFGDFQAAIDAALAR